MFHGPGFPEWPEKPETQVNVLCEGPSILDFEERNLLPGPVVAVNHALRVLGPRTDLWATSDKPDLLWNWGEAHRGPGLRYWTTDPNVHLWASKGEIVAQRRLYAADETVMDAGRELTVLPTIIPLLAWLLRLGARHIRIFGSDMLHQGSPIGQEPYLEEGCSKWNNAWRWRWGVERVLLAHTMRLARSQGTRVERYLPLRRQR